MREKAHKPGLKVHSGVAPSEKCKGIPREIRLSILSKRSLWRATRGGVRYQGGRNMVIEGKVRSWLAGRYPEGVSTRRNDKREGVLQI